VIDALSQALLDAENAWARARTLENQRDSAIEETARLRSLLNAPQIDNFLESVRVEAAHQCERWGVESDAGKSPTDWFWLLGYLSGKAVWAATHGDREKALHHTISSAACLLNWHAHMSGARTAMRPGIEAPKGEQP
jgi:hypothetical protein